MKARTLLPALFAVALTLGVLVSPAAAQEDPFDPNSNGSNGGPTTQGDTDDTTGAPEAPDPGTAPDTTAPADESLPNTGAETAPWIVLAYALMAAGAAALLVAYVRRPILPARTATGAAPRPGAARSSGSSR